MKIKSDFCKIELMRVLSYPVVGGFIALEQLLINSPKNDYVESGNNRQNSRKDLPLYLPGNGSLLLAAARIFNI
jgi:hypothetical protein